VCVCVYVYMCHDMCVCLGVSMSLMYGVYGVRGV